MRVNRRSTSRVCLAIWIAAAIPQARAEAPSITAVLTSSETALGTPVQLEIKITGASGITPPSTIQADGLDIRYTGESQNFVMRNFQTSSSVTLNYTIMPMKSGTFTIPPQNVRAGNTVLKTPELTLHVIDAPNRAARRNPSGNIASGDQAKLAFAELLVPKKTAYVGEAIPVVVRVGFISQARLEQVEPPQIDGQGFTAHPLDKADRNLETIAGHSYLVFTYKTAISAARAGSFQIGPAQEKASILVPRRSSSRRQPFDPFDGDDPFANPFFSDPFGAFLERREIEVKSEPVALEVKPLPPDAPATFAGAVGNFSMTADANPKRVQLGDPITIKAEVSGRGNFDGVNAPMLSEESGWHKYPPTGNFKADDDVGISGTKTFEMVVSPNEIKPSLPPLAFSYFDPVKEKYVTLQSNAVPLQVEGGATPVPSVVMAANSQSPSATPATRPDDILPQIPERGKIVQTFAPLYARREFWLAQLLPLAVALGLGAWKARTGRVLNRAALRAAGWQRERDELLRRLRREKLSPQQYYADASRLVQLKTALKRKIEPGSVNAEEVGRAFGLGETEQNMMRELFATSDEMRYSGGGNGALSPQRQSEALSLIESLS